MDERGTLVVISGPSGVGKTTVANLLCATDRYRESVSATTRAPRGRERDGVDYHFLSAEAFEERVTRGEFLEHAQVHGHRYGTLRSAVETILGAGRHCILNIDVQGARQLRASDALPSGDCRFVFLLPPDLETLERRLRERSTDSEEQVLDRLETAKREIEEASVYDLQVVNRVAEEAAEAVDRAVTSAAGQQSRP